MLSALFGCVWLFACSPICLLSSQFFPQCVHGVVGTDKVLRFVFQMSKNFFRAMDSDESVWVASHNSAMSLVNCDPCLCTQRNSSIAWLVETPICVQNTLYIFYRTLHFFVVVSAKFGVFAPYDWNYFANSL